MAKMNILGAAVLGLVLGAACAFGQQRTVQASPAYYQSGSPAYRPQTPAQPRTAAPAPCISAAVVDRASSTSIRARSIRAASKWRRRAIETHPTVIALGVSRVSALSARSRSRYSARAVNIR